MSDEPNVVRRVSISRFVFFMKAIAQNDLWDELQAHLEDLGHTEILVSGEQIIAIQRYLTQMLAEGITLSPRGKRIALCECRDPEPKMPAPWPDPIQPSVPDPNNPSNPPY